MKNIARITFNFCPRRDTRNNNRYYVAKPTNLVLDLQFDPQIRDPMQDRLKLATSLLG